MAEKIAQLDTVADVAQERLAASPRFAMWSVSCLDTPGLEFHLSVLVRQESQRSLPRPTPEALALLSQFR